MALLNGYETYRHSHVEGMDPKRLILMLYDGALLHLRLAKEAIQVQNIQKRGESLSKVIGIVSELNACLDSRYQDESIQFLRGLYAAMLAELPKVSLTNDMKTLDRAEAYIAELKNIWITTVMKMPTNGPTQTAETIPGETDGKTQPLTGNDPRMNLYKNFSQIQKGYGQKSISI